MPLKDYECEKCDKVYELYSTEEMPEEIECPQCGNPSQIKISMFGRYGINGPNDASTTPEKFGGRK